jgi:hypothetical protein
MFKRLSNDNGLKGCVMSKVRVDINGLISTKGKRSPKDFFLAFGANTECDNLLYNLFSFEIRSLLHGDLAEGIDIHSGVSQVNRIIFDFDFLRGVIDNTLDSDKDFHFD